MEPVQPVQMNTYESNTYRRDLSWLHADDEPRVRYENDMKTVFHSWLYGRYIEIQSNLKTSKKLHRTNQGSNFLGGSFSNRDNVRVPIQFRRDSSILKGDFYIKN